MMVDGRHREWPPRRRAPESLPGTESSPLPLPVPCKRLLQQRPQARDRERPQLRDPRFTDADDRPDLGERHLFLVIEREDLALTLGDLLNRAREMPGQLGALQLRFGALIGIQTQ